MNDITPPVQMPDDTPWWVKLLSVILIIVLLVLVVKLVVVIVKKCKQNRQVKKAVEKYSDRRNE